jgi:hypothetical protein
MSLISARNFSAPLQSKVQIGILVILALLVAAIRMSGSSGPSMSVPAERDTAPQAGGVADPRDEELVEFLQGMNKNRKDAAKRAGSPSDEELQGLMDGSFERDLQRKQDQQQKSGKFDDIRKSLGLE